MAGGDIACVAGYLRGLRGLVEFYNLPRELRRTFAGESTKALPGVASSQDLSIAVIRAGRRQLVAPSQRNAAIYALLKQSLGLIARIPHRRGETCKTPEPPLNESNEEGPTLEPFRIYLIFCA
jgi:hypothetical protein